MNTRQLWTRIFAPAVSAVLLLASSAQGQDFADVQIETVPVADGLYMLVGQGGNIGLSVGQDGAFLVDTQFAPLTERIQAAVRTAGGGDVKFVVNTHWHGDHTGGNENLANAGAVVVAHYNVRERMSTDQFMDIFDQRVEAAPPAARPTVTFADRTTFHWNGKTINVMHVPNAHTDGDAIVHFTNINAVHMGDTFFNGTYPFIDVSSGGNVNGIIAAAEGVLARTNATTRIIPGHGPLATPNDLRTYIEVVRGARDRVQALVDEGRSEDEVVMANPTQEWDAQWGGGFMNPETFTRLVYRSLTDR